MEDGVLHVSVDGFGYVCTEQPFENYQITLGGSAKEDCSIGELVGPGFSYDGIVDAVETVVDTYLGLRLSPDEPFIDAVRRVGLPPFKEALYGQRN